MKKVTLEKIVEIINKALDENIISVNQANDNLEEFGIDSIRFIQIIVSLEETFECEIPDSKLLLTEMNTAQKLFDTLQEIYKGQSN